MAKKIFTLTRRVFSHRFNNRGNVKCYGCRKDLVIGDQVVSKRTNNGSKSELYHLECAKERYVI